MKYPRRWGTALLVSGCLSTFTILSALAKEPVEVPTIDDAATYQETAPGSARSEDSLFIDLVQNLAAAAATAEASDRVVLLGEVRSRLEEIALSNPESEILEFLPRHGPQASPRDTSSVFAVHADSSGVFSDVLRTVDLIGDVRSRISCLNQITALQLERGSLDSAARFGDMMLAGLDPGEVTVRRCRSEAGEPTGECPHSFPDMDNQIDQSVMLLGSALAIAASVEGAAGNFRLAQDRFDAAVTISRSILLEHNWDLYLASVAARQGRSGLFEDALATAAVIRGQEATYSSLAEIGRAQASAGLINEAMAITHRISDAFQGHAVSLLAAIGRAQAHDERLEDARQSFGRALDLAREIQFEYEHGQTRAIARSLIEIATAQGEAGLLDDARLTFENSISTALSLDAAFEDRRIALLRESSVAQMQVGLADGARQTASRIDALTQERFRVFYVLALADLALAQAEYGLLSEARHTFAEAVSVATELETGEVNFVGTNSLLPIAERQIAAGMAEDSLQTAELAMRIFSAIPAQTEDFHYVAEKRDILLALASAQAAVGEIELAGSTFSDAVLTLLEGRPSSVWVQQIGSIARRMAEAGLGQRGTQILYVVRPHDGVICQAALAQTALILDRLAED